MKIEYEISPEDVIHYNEFHQRTSPAIKRRINLLRYGMPVFFFIVLLPSIISVPAGNLLIWIIISSAWFYFIPKYYRNAANRQLRKLVREGKNKNIFTKHTLTISDEGLTEETASSSSIIKWSSVERIARDNKNIYIYVSALSAHVIPLRFFRSIGESEEFYKKVDSYIKEAQTFPQR